jgi:hypothetical protein
LLLIGTSVSGYLLTTDAYWGSKTAKTVRDAFADVTPVSSSCASLALRLLAAKKFRQIRDSSGCCQQIVSLTALDYCD